MKIMTSTILSNIMTIIQMLKNNKAIRKLTDATIGHYFKNYLSILWQQPISIIKTAFDGFPVRNFPNPGIIDPVRIILNLAIEPWALPNQTTPFPSEMLVDYVRVYELDNDCNTIMNVCNYYFPSQDNKVKKNITIGNWTCTNTIGSGQNIYLRASEGVLINGDFTISLGSELYIDVNSCY